MAQGNFSKSAQNTPGKKVPDTLKNYDIEQKLKQTSKDIKLALYNVGKVVDDGKFHLHLINRQPTRLEIQEGIPCHCKVDVRGMTPPLCLMLKHKTKGDVTVYGSTKHHEPDSENYQTKFINPAN